MDVQTWYLRTSKVALALAIIRSKPADKTSREYTEHLATLVSERESKWRSKVEALETEVLQLRQKLLLSTICSGLLKDGKLPSQEPLSSESTLTLMDDSGCDLSNEQRTEPLEPSLDSTESCISLPFLPLPLVKKPHTTPENPLSSHMQFLQHLLELKKFMESGTLKTDLTHFEKDSSTISDSVLQLLDGLITFYHNPRLPFSNFWTEAVGTLAQLASDCNLSNLIVKKCYKKLEEFKKTLLQAILETSNINRFQVQHYLSKSLVILGSCSLLRKSIVPLLLSEINSFTDYLEAINQVQATYDVTRYENIFFLLWILEQLLQIETKEHSSCIDHDDPEIKKFLQKLDGTVFQLSDAFPLFTFYLWRLGILLNSAKMEIVGSSALP
ncbi:meiosis-specific protein MEI4 [Dipodomys spectabilis]|uniref:meiosis-specific protein MEI4 n=1 Tax=Dipodomys spectabilis TaxID=105255 RepID=UPI001C54A49A|nr:meiosis-specific protein MEI4 [Dipodomys spectabilis]